MGKERKKKQSYDKRMRERMMREKKRRNSLFTHLPNVTRKDYQNYIRRYMKK